MNELSPGFPTALDAQACFRALLRAFSTPGAAVELPVALIPPAGLFPACAALHATADYGAMHVKLYEEITRFGRVALSYDYPVMVNNRYLMSPSPIPAFDNPKLSMNPALQLFGVEREKRIYALPPYTEIRSLDFEDHPFHPGRADEPCARCGATDSYLDEIVADDKGGRSFICSDTDYCESRQEQTI